MNKLYKIFSFWLCVMTIAGVLAFNNNAVFASITLSEECSGIDDHPTMVMKFDEQMDIMKLNMALHDVFESLSKHTANAMCPYDLVYPMFISSFEYATANTCFFGNNDVIVKKICGIFTDIILKDSKVSDCSSLRIIFLNYREITGRAEKCIAEIVSAAYNRNVPEIRAVYTADEGYKLVI